MNRRLGAVAAALVVLAACSGSPDGDSADPIQPTVDATSVPTIDTTPESTPETEPDAGPDSVPALTVPAFTSPTYSNVDSWLCHPGIDDDPCDGDTSVTVIAEDGSTSIEASAQATDPPVDCFYVYPTSSDDPTVASDLVPGTEAGAAFGQARPFNGLCRVFAPMYRSVTLAGLSQGFTGETSFADIAAVWTAATDDVIEAWRHYLANDNQGRGVILIGHSQGSGHLTELLDTVIDPDPAQRDLLVSAYIMGGSVAVPEGEDVGGLLQEIPLCRQPGQFGCVVTYSSYEDAVPAPPSAFFGRPAPLFTGAAPDGVAGCVNPADLGGPGAPAAGLSQRFPAGQWSGPAVDTPYVDVVGAVTARCVLRDGLSYLEIIPNDANPNAANLPLTTGDPNWGLHVIDIQVGAGSLIEVARAQIEAFVKR